MTEPVTTTIQAQRDGILSDHHQILFLGLHNVDPAPGRKNLVPVAVLRRLLEEFVHAGYSLDLAQVGQRRLVLTFDDGRALDDAFCSLLDEFGVRGIFFVCTADRIRSYPDGPLGAGLTAANVDYLCRRHVVGSHTLDHQDLTALADVDLERYLTESFDTFEQTFGFRPWTFSYPWGKHNRTVIRQLRRLDISHAFAACSGVPSRWMSDYLIPRVFVDFLPQDRLDLDLILAERRRVEARAKLLVRNLLLLGVARRGTAAITASRSGSGPAR